MSISKKIERFERIFEVKSCVLANGRFATQNCRLIRNITIKKTNVCSKDGRITWADVESVSMVCPVNSTKNLTPLTR